MKRVEILFAITASLAMHAGIIAAFRSGGWIGGSSTEPDVFDVSYEESIDAATEGENSPQVKEEQTPEILDRKAPAIMPVSKKDKKRSKNKSSEQQPKESAGTDSGGAGKGSNSGVLPATEPVLIDMPKPEYPRTSRYKGQAGKCELLLSVTTDGTVSSAVVDQSSGSAELDEAARISAEKARFEPATVLGVPLPSQKRLAVRFELLDDKK